MSLHRLASFTYQVPNVAETSAYYEDFGLIDNGDGSFSTVDGGRQLYLEQGPYRRISGTELGVYDSDDLDRVAAQLRALHVEVHSDGQQQGADLVDATAGMPRGSTTSTRTSSWVGRTSISMTPVAPEVLKRCWAACDGFSMVASSRVTARILASRMAAS